MAWEDFAKRHPDGTVLSTDAGFRNYGVNPYPGYDTVDQPPFFPADNLDDGRLPPKARVVFLVHDTDEERRYLFSGMKLALEGCCPDVD